MKRIQKGAPVCLPIVLIVGIVAGWMVVEQAGVTPFEAQGSGGKPELRKVPASPTPPSEVQQLLNLPGRRETLEKARRGERPTGMKWDEVGNFLSWLNPFNVTEAEAGATFTLTLSHTLNASGQYNLFSWGSPYGSACVFGAYESYSTPSSTWSYVPRSAKNWGDGTSNTLQGYVYMYVVLPADGWYIVSLNANTSGSVSLRHQEGVAFPVLQTQTLGNGWKDYPFLGYFTAGSHNFCWTFSASAYVTQMTVDSHP